MKKGFIKFISIVIILVYYTLPLGAQNFRMPITNIREEVCINGEWDFTPNATKVKTVIRVPATYTNNWAGKYGKQYWDAFGFPHNWNPKGAVYEKQVAFPRSFLGKHVRLKMYGCKQSHHIEFEGQSFPTVHDGYVPHVYNLGQAKEQLPKLLKVIISDEKTRLMGGESAESKGIDDDVMLYAVNNQFVEEGLQIRTLYKEKKIEFNFAVRNMDQKPATVVVKAFITDKAGKIVKSIDCGKQTILADSIKNFAVAEKWNDPHLWFPHDPYLYHLTTVVYNQQGKPIDSYKERFGFREISYDGPLLFINGRKLFLRGHGEHYLGDLQSSRQYYLTWLTELKKLGVNFMRLHIYPRPQELYRVADELGFLLEGEPCFHFMVPADSNFAKQHLGDMMRGLINHPSIIMWSVSNELRWKGGGEKPWLVKFAKSVDRTRPVFSSDFSEYSVAGDLIGHHYNTETVWTEWEKFGPNKPMIWDECGEVWQPNRPLSNGTAGFEVTAQDYATGQYRDGNDEIKKAMDFIREGRTFAGKFHRMNAVVPWDFGYVFFRWQPFNRFKGIEPVYRTLNGMGMKQKQIPPCSSPINIWDSTLPVFEPNPGFYLFEEDMKAVRFHHESKNYCFYGGANDSIKTPLFIYDDLRYADKVTCRIETLDGKIMTTSVQKMTLQPGDMLYNQRWNFNFPIVSVPTAVRVVREFSYKGEKGYADVRIGKIIPRLSAPTLSNHSVKIGIIDTDGKLTNALKKAAFNCKLLTGKVKRSDADVLLVKGNLPNNAYELMAGGMRIIHFAGVDTLENNAARLLVNGAPFKVLSGISQTELTYWRGGNTYKGLPISENQQLNERVIVAGDKDGKSAALKQIYFGKGTLWQTTLKIVESLGVEPAADALLTNLIREATMYQPTVVASLGVYGSDDFVKFVNDSASAKVVTALTNEHLSVVNRLFVDARNLQLSINECKALSAFVERGGKLLLYQTEKPSLPTVQNIVSPNITLTQPYLDETTNCIKAATSWTLRSTPATPIEYYKDIVIPQPFEPNYSPFLAGLPNIMLNWEGKSLFTQGITHQSVSAVSPNNHFRILLSNWRNDWSLPPFGAEYINEGKDMRQALWYLNRNALWASVQKGMGEVHFCQIHLLEGEKKGQYLLKHLLTQWNCSIGNVLTVFPTEAQVFDETPAKKQTIRLNNVEKQLSALQPMKAIPDVFFEKGSKEKQTERSLFLLLDNRMQTLVPEIIYGVRDFANVSYSSIHPDSPDELLNNFETALTGSKWKIIYFTFGYNGIKDFSNESLAAFDSKVDKIIQRLKATKALLLWGTQPPFPMLYKNNVLSNDDINKLNKRVQAKMEANGVLVNDTYEYIVNKTPEYLQQEQPTLIGSSNFFKGFTPKLRKSIVEAIKFFGN